MGTKILLVEDAEESKELVLKALGSSFDFTWVDSLKKAGKLFKDQKFDLVLLDIELPDGDGFHFYSMLKNEDTHKDTPVIFLTARDSLSDRVMGITMGAEDYIVKPFYPQELRARVEMRLKKKVEGQKNATVLKKGPLEINLGEQRAYVIRDGARNDLGLTALEFRILAFVASHDEQVYSRDQILNSVWGGEVYLTDRTIDTHIYSLRKKLGPDAHVIQSVYGQGYRFSLEKHDMDAASTKTSKKAG